ncbi:response regulator [Gulosibacter sediminis]|uniref:response regulator n=1 Tax=Gulosibacter sediminis TaxID=1729695 RepID=UPI0024AD8FA3|nr:response regulator transcription factor [Gulosibacter sediminis]
MTRVLLADDHAAIRAGLRMMLEAADDIEVVGEASDGATAIGNARALKPDVVLMDMRMPGVDGAEATRVLAAEGTRVLVLTTYDEDDVVFAAINAGAAGFLLKTAEPSELVDAIRRVARGQGVVAPEVTARVLQAAAGARSETPAAAQVRGAGLTERELEILGAIGRGATNGEIAGELHITLGTTKQHVSRILAKLGVSSRTQAALLARDAAG